MLPRKAASSRTREIQVTNGSETGKLQQAMKEMSAKLAEIIREVREGSAAVAAAASQVAGRTGSFDQKDIRACPGRCCGLGGAVERSHADQPGYVTGRYGYSEKCIVGRGALEYG